MKVIGVTLIQITHCSSTKLITNISTETNGYCFICIFFMGSKFSGSSSTAAEICLLVFVFSLKQYPFIYLIRAFVQ